MNSAPINLKKIKLNQLDEFVALKIFAPDGIARKGYLVLSISRNKNKTTIKRLDYCDSDTALI